MYKVALCEWPICNGYLHTSFETAQCKKILCAKVRLGYLGYFGYFGQFDAAVAAAGAGPVHIPKATY